MCIRDRHYTKCTAADRDRRLGELSEAFKRETDCLKYLSEIQSHINSTQTTAVLLQDLEANMLIEMCIRDRYNGQEK